MHNLYLFHMQVYQFTRLISVTVCGVIIINSCQDKQRHWTCVRELFVFYYTFFYNSSNQPTAWTQKVLINKHLPQKVFANKPLVLFNKFSSPKTNSSKVLAHKPQRAIKAADWPWVSRQSSTLAQPALPHLYSILSFNHLSCSSNIQDVLDKTW